MEEQEVPVNIRLAARLVAGAIRRIKSQRSAPQSGDNRSTDEQCIAGNIETIDWEEQKKFLGF